MTQFDDAIFSDLHKDAYGTRPRAATWNNWKSATSEEKQIWWDQMCLMVEENIKNEKNAQKLAQEVWEARISKLMSDHKIFKKDAIRWDMDSQRISVADEGIGYYCYVNGLSYDMEPEIKQLLE